METEYPLRPTLWRTSRVIAHRKRLAMFRLLLRCPGLTVSAVAQELGHPLSLTSECLRAMEARGLLAARRAGRRVSYRPSPASNPNVAAGLVAALRKTFQGEPQPVQTILRLATAFTHPRRIEIFRALQTHARSLAELHAATGIPGWSLRRHLKKLQARDFVRRQGTRYAVVSRPDAFGRALARLAAGELRKVHTSRSVFIGQRRSKNAGWKTGPGLLS